MLGATTLYDNGDKSAAAVQAVADALRADGGVFQVNHPAKRLDRLPARHRLGATSTTSQPDTVEVWNISRLYQPPLPSGSNNDDAVRYWEGWLDRGAKIAATGGSDNHWRSTFAAQGVGQPTTWVFARERTRAGILEGLRAGRTFISHQPPNLGGPRLFLEGDGTMVGDEVAPGTPLQGARGGRRRHVPADHRDGRRAARRAGAGDRAELPARLPGARGARASDLRVDGGADLRPLPRPGRARPQRRRLRVRLDAGRVRPARRPSCASRSPGRRAVAPSPISAPAATSSRCARATSPSCTSTPTEPTAPVGFVRHVPDRRAATACSCSSSTRAASRPPRSRRRSVADGRRAGASTSSCRSPA